MGKKNLIKGYICVVLSAVIFGLVPLMVKLIYAQGVDPKSLILLRNIISIPCFYFLTLCSGESIKIRTAAIPSILFAAVTGCCVTPFLLFTSYKYLPSGTATVLHFIYPAAVVVGELIFLKNKAGIWRIISVVMCVIGIGLFYDPGSAISLKGGFFAVLSGFAYAAYIICLSGFGYAREISCFKFGFYMAAFSALIMPAVSLFSGNINIPHTFSGWMLVAVFSVFMNVGAVTLFNKGTFLIGGGRASVISTFEPVTSIIAGMVFFGEKATVFTAVGSVLVIAASVLIAVFDVREP